jgi:hypothetical protein
MLTSVDNLMSAQSSRAAILNRFVILVSERAALSFYWLALPIIVSLDVAPDAAMATICYALDELKFGNLPDCEGTLYIEKREVSRV